MVPRTAGAVSELEKPRSSVTVRLPQRECDRSDTTLMPLAMTHGRKMTRALVLRLQNGHNSYIDGSGAHRNFHQIDRVPSANLVNLLRWRLN